MSTRIMKRLITTLAVAVGLAIPAAANATTLVGQNTLGTVDGAGTIGGQILAFGYAARATGTGVSFILNFSGLNQAAVDVGVYSQNAAGTAPETLLGAGEFTSDGLSGWRKTTISSTSISSSDDYWLAVLNTGGPRSFDYFTADDSNTDAVLLGSQTSLPVTWPSSYAGYDACCLQALVTTG